MSNEIIKKITIDIAGKEIVITLEQAKQLYAALSDLLGSQKVIHEHTYPNRFWYSNGNINVPCVQSLAADSGTTSNHIGAVVSSSTGKLPENVTLTLQ